MFVEAAAPIDVPMQDAAILEPTPVPPTPARRDATTTSTPSSKGGVVSASTPSSSSFSPSFRLLYRGALALPDSFLLLDGLTFVARLETPSKASAFALMENPLALALESMRGRPSLRFLGTVRMSDLWLDGSGGVEMDIHPHAFLSRVYFENMFCLLAFPSGSQRSEIGIKIALGDTDGGMTEIVVYAQITSNLMMSPCMTANMETISSAPPSGPQTIRLAVARIAQRPETRAAKRPRPDDLVPRKPPASFVRDPKRSSSLRMVGPLKRVASAGPLGIPLGGPAKKPRVSRHESLVDLANDATGGTGDREMVFKVPDLPGKSTNTKGKGKERDVFGDVAEVTNASKPAAVLGQDDVEKENKNLVKRAVIDYLAKTKDPTTSVVIDKQHPEFKDMYNAIYRGVTFALRHKMRVCPVDMEVVLKLIEAHGRIYIQ